MSNILEVTFESGQTFATATRLWKGDYGQILLIHGPELPSYYEVHFASTKDGTPEVSVGTPSGVQIPNRLLQAEGYIYAWVFLHVGEHDGETKFQVKIPVEERGIPIDQETPEDQTAVQQAIAALNAETGRAEAAADAASVSEQNAKASEDAALLSEQNAETAAQAAAASAQSAASSEEGAAESEAAAATKAQEAAASAAAAAASAAEAGGSEETVAEYARQAGEAADTALQYGVLAVQSAQDAEASAQTAETYGEAAIEAKTTATTAAATATQKAQEASTDAGIAASHAATAVSKATEAVQSANDAAQSAADAADSADDADDSAAAARLHNEQAQAASTAAQTAAGNASAAQTAAEAAQTAAETAQDGAEDAQDAAEAAQSSAEEAQTAAETAQGLAEAAQTAAEAAQDAAEDAAEQAQEWAESIDPDNFASTEDLDDLAERVINLYPVDTADGPVASFPDGADDIPLKSLIVDINPVQDLHGYDSPWPAGGGANKWDEEWELGIYSTESYAKVDNANRIRCKTPIKVSPSTAYYFKDGSNVAFRIIQYDASMNILANAFYLNEVFTTDANCAYITIHSGVNDYGTVYNHDIAINYPSTVTTYSPYENLCPISGWDKVGLNHAGKNLFDPTGLSMISCYGINGDAMIRRGKRLDLPPGNYVFSSTNLNGLTAYIYVDICNADGSFFSFDYAIGGQTATTPRPYTLTEGQYFLVYDAQAKLESDVNKFEYYSIQIEKGSTASPYEPYTADPIINIIFPDELGTVYGAQINVLTGDGIVDMAAVDMGSLSWTKYGSTGFYCSYAQVKKATNNIRCSIYKSVETSTDANFFPVAAIDMAVNTYIGSNGLRVKDTSYAEKTAVEFIADVTGQTICYELDTPIPFHVDPHDIYSFLGTNNIWADTGDTHAIYRADIGLYIQKLTGSTEEDMTANQNIASGKYFLVGNTLYLSTSAIAAGEQIIPGTNCTLTNLAAALNALNS